jgi:hypothetical protein
MKSQKTYTLKQRIVGIAIFTAILFPILFFIVGLKNGLWFSDSPEAKELKAMMAPIAERLDEAEKVGGIIRLNDLLDRQIRALNYSSAVMKENKDSPFVYCNMAVINLSNGIDETMRTRRWSSRDQYKAALDRCK